MFGHQCAAVMNIDDVMLASAIRSLVSECGGHVIESTDLADYAVEYASRGWPVFPLWRDKTPAVKRGVLDATTNLPQVISWWRDTHVGCSIGLRVPNDLIVIDIDPRNDGELHFRKMCGKFGTMPETMLVYSGRGDGGRHYYMRKPDGYDPEQRISTKGLKVALGIERLGIDVKTNRGYVVAPPSPHPATGKPYVAENFGRFALCPQWLWYRLTHDESPRPKITEPHDYDDNSPADWFTAHTTWNQVLEPHGWNVVGMDGNSDGSMWRHPAATSPISATIRHGELFVYSPNTPFEQTETGDPHGYTRFRAFAVLNHNGDLTAAAIRIAKARMGL